MYAITNPSMVKSIMTEVNVAIFLPYNFNAISSYRLAPNSSAHYTMSQPENNEIEAPNSINPKPI